MAKSARYAENLENSENLSNSSKNQVQDAEKLHEMFENQYKYLNNELLSYFLMQIICVEYIKKMTNQV